jgi:hypothetical protein
MLTNAALELAQVLDELAAWRGGSAGPGIDRLTQLQSLLTRIDTVDARAGEARRTLTAASSRSAEAGAAISRYESALQAALREFQQIEEMLESERSRMSPRIDAGVREHEARSAYARALSRA